MHCGGIKLFQKQKSFASKLKKYAAREQEKKLGKIVGSFMVPLLIPRTAYSKYTLCIATAQKKCNKIARGSTHTHTISSLIISTSVAFSFVFYSDVFMRLLNCAIKCKQSKFPRHDELRETHIHTQRMMVCFRKRCGIKLYNHENHNLIKQFDCLLDGNQTKVISNNTNFYDWKMV